MAKTTLALVGSDSLLGREIRDLVATSAPEWALRLIAADEERPGTLTRVGDEPAMVAELDARSLEGARAVFLAGSAESTARALKVLAGQAVPAIDLTAASEARPDTRLRAPMVEADGQGGGGQSASTSSGSVQMVAHPAAIALALFLRRLSARERVRRAVIEIFAPASEHGAAGVAELQQQTISLLSFKKMPRTVFDTQSAFNLLARYGEVAPVPLEQSERRIERHLATLLALPHADGFPMPSLKLVQAPVFHGYSFSAWVEFEKVPGLPALESGLVSGSIEVRGADFEPPNNVGQAGQGGISIGGISADRNHPEAAWFWGVADNVRLAAENAVAVARELA